MLLHPLTQVGIGMFVSVRVGSSQLMMNVLSYRKRGQDQEQKDQTDPKPISEPLHWEGDTHRTDIEYHKVRRAVKMSSNR